MSRALQAVPAAMTLLLAATSLRADERNWVGGAIGVHGMPKQMLGDAPEILSGLTGGQREHATMGFHPELAFGFDLSTRSRHTTGIDLRLGWMGDWVGTSDAAAVQYRIRRDVLPLEARFRLTVGRRRTHFVMACGPLLAISRVEEHGWLGDGTATRPAGGVAFTIGGRTEVASIARISYLAFIHALYLPQKNRLIGDGGGTIFGGATLGVDWGL